MRKTTIIALASTFVAASASLAMAQPGRYYPGDHLLDYDPVNQAYQWQINGNSQPAQPSTSAFASARDSRHQVFAPALRQYPVPDAWTKAREDDALEAGTGGN